MSESYLVKKSTGIQIAIIAVIVIVIAVIGSVWLVNKTNQPSAGASASPQASNEVTGNAVADDTRFLDKAGPEAVTVVEFLDFECPACLTMYSVVEDLRETYSGQINYAVRYFPLPSHINAMPAAIAVEAAAQQGAMEGMYQMVFETQTEWTGNTEGIAERFRGYAETLGLDLETYDAAVADPTTESRVIADRDAGQELGVNGTPTFFVDGVALQLTAVEDLAAAIDSAIAQR